MPGVGKDLGGALFWSLFRLTFKGLDSEFLKT
jgi:hypothetical protein